MHFNNICTHCSTENQFYILNFGSGALKQYCCKACSNIFFVPYDRKCEKVSSMTLNEVDDLFSKASNLRELGLAYEEATSVIENIIELHENRILSNNIRF